MTRYPRYSPWLDEAVDAKLAEGPPRFLGASRQIKGEMFHGQVQSGDCFVLAELVLGQIASREQIEDALSSGDPEASARSLVDLVGGEDIAVAVVQFDSDMDDLAAPAFTGRESASGSQSTGRRTPGRKLPPPNRRAPAPAGRGPLSSLPHPQIDLQKLGDRVRAGLAVLLVLLVRALKWGGHNAKVLFLRTLPGSGDGTDVPAKRKAPPKAARDKQKDVKAAKEARQAKEAALKDEQRAKEEPPPAPRKPRSGLLHAAKGNKALKYAAFVIPVLIVVILGLLYFERGQETRSQFSELVQSAQSNREKALAEMADVNQARSLLSAALKSLDEAAALSPQATEVTQLRKDVQDKIDQVNQVKRLYWSPELHRYGTPGTDLKRIVVDGINVYVLDRGKNQVFKHTLNETNDGFQEMKDNPVVVKQGDQVGDVVVAELLDMTWVPAGGGRQTSNLVILDKKGMLYDYSPTFGVKHRPLADTGKWLFPQVVHGFYGNMYVLDTHLSQIMKYLPTSADNGYGNSPIDYLNNKVKSDLTGAIDMAIDGSIYVLYANGSIVKFLNGEPTAFQVSGLEQPLNNPSSLFVSTDEGTQYLYVADRGNRRVVQLTKEGRFQRQFKANTFAFDDLRSLWVDELDQKMYALSGSSVFAANLVSE